MNFVIQSCVESLGSLIGELVWWWNQASYFVVDCGTNQQTVLSGIIINSSIEPVLKWIRSCWIVHYLIQGYCKCELLIAWACILFGIRAEVLSASGCICPYLLICNHFCFIYLFIYFCIPKLKTIKIVLLFLSFSFTLHKLIKKTHKNHFLLAASSLSFHKTIKPIKRNRFVSCWI